MKKAILVVSFGTTYQEALKAGIESVEDKIRANFPDYEVRRAFTSRIIIKKIAERDGIQIDTEKEALERLQTEGYTEVFIQPLHVVAGEEYDKIKEVVEYYGHGENKMFDKIAMGRPLLYYTGQEGKPDDYLKVIQAIKTQWPELGDQEAVVFMGHGGVHPSNTAYAALQIKMEEARLKSFIFTAEGYPAIEQVIDHLKENNIKKVILTPFMVVAGAHVHDYMAGDEEDSAKSMLNKAGFKVEVCLHGLGENEKIQDIYVQHVQDTIQNK
jgi:sirohydrochlorin cobaltochelatase